MAAIRGSFLTFVVGLNAHMNLGNLTAKLVSAVFHPMLIVLYVVGFSLVANPYLFGLGRLEDKVLLLLFTFFTGLFIPGIAILMMRAVQLLPDLKLADKRDRIFPFIATGIFYLWMIRNIWSNPDVPLVLKAGVLGLVISLFLSFFVNNFEKLSVHAVGAGALLSFVVIQVCFFSFDTLQIRISDGIWSIDRFVPIALAALVAGCVGSARLFLKKHRPHELWLGYFVGITGQMLAFYFMNR